MPRADMENGPSPKDIPWYAHFDTWAELFEVEFEKDPDHMETGQMYRHEVLVEGGGPDEYRKMLVDNVADALTEYEYNGELQLPDGWSREDRDEQIWEAVMNLTYFDWIRKHTDMFCPAMAEIDPPKS